MRRSKPSGPPKSPKRPGASTASWTIPRPAEVIAYSYLWHREAEAGREEGVKDRPVVVVVAIEARPHGTQLLVVPVTTRPPRDGNAAVEMPAAVRRHLGLGDDPGWIVADEVNSFTWPGPDIRPIRRGGEISPRYGFIPGKLFEQVRARLAEAAKAGRLKMTKRTE
jgi:mRNA-degrading endonuclease toxin of MazEF toxin-antitoxin module